MCEFLNEVIILWGWVGGHVCRWWTLWRVWKGRCELGRWIDVDWEEEEEVWGLRLRIWCSLSVGRPVPDLCLRLKTRSFALWHSNRAIQIRSIVDQQLCNFNLLWSAGVWSWVMLHHTVQQDPSWLGRWHVSSWTRCQCCLALRSHLHNYHDLFDPKPIAPKYTLVLRVYPPAAVLASRRTSLVTIAPDLWDAIIEAYVSDETLREGCTEGR